MPPPAGDAIKESRGIIAVIDEKFCGSTYCNNELAMAQGNGLLLFPLLILLGYMADHGKFQRNVTDMRRFPHRAGCISGGSRQFSG